MGRIDACMCDRKLDDTRGASPLQRRSASDFAGILDEIVSSRVQAFLLECVGLGHELANPSGLKPISKLANPSRIKPISMLANASELKPIDED